MKRRVCFACERPLEVETALAPAEPPQAQARSQPGGRTDALRGGLFWTRGAAQFFRQWANLIHSGMTVGESLRHLELHSAPAYRRAAGAMAVEVEAGRQVAEIMEGHRRLFLRWQVAMVRAGETGGALEQVVEQIASDLEADFRMRVELLIRTWHFWVLTIPGILMVLPVALTIMGPEPAGGWTPLSLGLKVLFYALTVSAPLGSLLVGVALANRLAARWARWQEIRQEINLRVPLLGRMLRRAALARFFGSLSLLTGAGVPVGRAAEIAADATGNEAMAARLRPAGDWLRAGGTLTEALDRGGLLSRDDLQLLGVGELAGQAPDALGRVAEMYQQQTQHDMRIYPLVVQLVGYALLAPIVGYLVYVLYSYYWQTPLRLLDDLDRGLP